MRIKFSQEFQRKRDRITQLQEELRLLKEVGPQVSIAAAGTQTLMAAKKSSLVQTVKVIKLNKECQVNFACNDCSDIRTRFDELKTKHTELIRKIGR